MRNITVTFSLPESLNRRLHAFVEKRSLSRFVSKAIEHALADEEKDLKAAYAAANNDPDRKEVIKDWAILDGEDWNE